VAAEGIEVVLLKLDRARYHNDQAQAIWDQFYSSGVYKFIMRMDERPPYTIRFLWDLRARTEEEQKVLTDLGLIFADFLGNLRSALDHLAWRLVEISGTQPHNRTSFPAAKTQAAWLTARGREVRGIAPELVAIIDEVQPYHDAYPERNLLWVLDEVNNLNKHRVIPATAESLGTFRLLYTAPDGIERKLSNTEPKVRVVNGEEFIAITADPLCNNPNVSLLDPDIRYSFEDGLNHDNGWSYTNADLINLVNSIIGQFEPAFRKQAEAIP
jgi:hypothetical protein